MLSPCLEENGGDEQEERVVVLRPLTAEPYTTLVPHFSAHLEDFFCGTSWVERSSGEKILDKAAPVELKSGTMVEQFKPSLPYDYPLNPPNSAPGPIRGCGEMTVIPLTNQAP